jgi:chromosome segregation ATPase
LSKIQDENDTIRQRYLELEDAWQSLGAECKQLREENADLKAENATKTAELTEARAVVASLEEKLNDVHASFVEQRNLAEDTKQTLVTEQLELGKKTKESDLLRRESVSQENELRKLREAWNEREARVARLEEQRTFYETQLAELGEEYQAMVDRLSFVASDYNVRTAPLQVRVGGGYEVLSNYLNRAFEEQNHIATQYKRLEKPPMSPALSPRAFPIQVTPTASPSSRVHYEPLRGQMANWPTSLRC